MLPFPFKKVDECPCEIMAHFLMHSLDIVMLVGIFYAMKLFAFWFWWECSKGICRFVNESGSEKPKVFFYKLNGQKRWALTLQ